MLALNTRNSDAEAVSSSAWVAAAWTRVAFTVRRLARLSECGHLLRSIASSASTSASTGSNGRGRSARIAEPETSASRNAVFCPARGEGPQWAEPQTGQRSWRPGRNGKPRDPVCGGKAVDAWFARRLNACSQMCHEQRESAFARPRGTARFGESEAHVPDSGYCFEEPVPLGENTFRSGAAVAATSDQSSASRAQAGRVPPPSQPETRGDARGCPAGPGRRGVHDGSHGWRPTLRHRLAAPASLAPN